MPNELGLNQSLFIQAFLIFQNLESYVFSLFVIIAFQNNAERTFTEFLSNFPAVSHVLVGSRDILIAFGIKSIICLVIEDTHI